MDMIELERIKVVRRRFDKATQKIKKQIKSKADIHSKEFRLDVEAYLKKNTDEMDQGDWRKLLYFMSLSDELLYTVLFSVEDFLDNSADIDIDRVKSKADEYTDILFGYHTITIGSYSDMTNRYIDCYNQAPTFGSRIWAETLEKKYREGMEYSLYQEIKNFSDNWIAAIGVGDLADARRLDMSQKWALLAERRNKEVGDEDSLFNVISFRSELFKERQAGLLTKKEFDSIDKVFSKAYIYEYDRSPAGQEELKDLEQKSKGLSIWIWILIQLGVFGIFLILAKGFFIGAVMLWGVCTPVVLPLQLIGGAFLACAIANAVTFGDREPSEEYKAEEAAVLGGMIVGGIHAGIGCAKELSKPGWIKDSKKV